MIDVILIIHKCDKNVENTIFNLMKQKDFINLILVDNENNPKIQDLLKFYSKKYDLPLIYNKHYNIRIAKEEALERCKNDYVFFCGGNDTIPDNYFKNLFDPNYDIIFGGFLEKKYSYIDFINENISSSIYGKIIKKDIFIFSKMLNYEEYDNFYSRCDENTKIIQKPVLGYKHVSVEKNPKEFSAEYRKYLFFYNQYKYFKDEEYSKIVIEKMIEYGNNAYSKMITNKDRYKVEMNNIKSCYICLKNDYGAKYNKAVFNKIKNGKFTVNDINTQKFKLLKKIKELIKKVIDEFKPIKSSKPINEIKVNKKRKVKK